MILKFRNYGYCFFCYHNIPPLKLPNFSVTALCYYNRKNKTVRGVSERERDTKEKQSMKKDEVNEHKCENNFYSSSSSYPSFSPQRTARAIKMCHECFMDKFIKTSTAILKWNFDYKLRYETHSLLCLHCDTFVYEIFNSFEWW